MQLVEYIKIGIRTQPIYHHKIDKEPLVQITKKQTLPILNKTPSDTEHTKKPITEKESSFLFYFFSSSSQEENFKFETKA